MARKAPDLLDVTFVELPVLQRIPTVREDNLSLMCSYP